MSPSLFPIKSSVNNLLFYLYADSSHLSNLMISVIFERSSVSQVYVSEIKRTFR